jgi:hypothetical protein
MAIEAADGVFHQQQWENIFSMEGRASKPGRRAVRALHPNAPFLVKSVHSFIYGKIASRFQEWPSVYSRILDARRRVLE